MLKKFCRKMSRLVSFLLSNTADDHLATRDMESYPLDEFHTLGTMHTYPPSSHDASSAFEDNQVSRPSAVAHTYPPQTATAIDESMDTYNPWNSSRRMRDDGDQRVRASNISILILADEHLA